MSAKAIQLTQNGVMKYPRTLAELIAVRDQGKLLSTVLTELGAEDVRLAGLISALDEKIAILSGSEEGSVDKKIADAIDAFATKVTDDETINTVKELFDYVGEHGAEFSALLGRVSTAEGEITILEGKVSALEGDNTTNKANIASNTEAINGLNTKVGSSADEASAEGSLYARLAQLKADLAALSGDGGSVATQIGAAIENFNTETVAPLAQEVAGIKGDYLKGSDKEELNQAIGGKVAQSAYDSKVQELEGKISANETAAGNAQTHSEGVAQNLADHIADNVKHITAEERAAWNAKIDYVEVGSETYPDFNEIISNEA